MLLFCFLFEFCKELFLTFFRINNVIFIQCSWILLFCFSFYLASWSYLELSLEDCSSKLIHKLMKLNWECHKYKLLLAVLTLSRHPPHHHHPPPPQKKPKPKNQNQNKTKQKENKHLKGCMFITNKSICWCTVELQYPNIIISNNM